MNILHKIKVNLDDRMDQLVEILSAGGRGLYTCRASGPFTAQGFKINEKLILIRSANGYRPSCDLDDHVKWRSRLSTLPNPALEGRKRTTEDVIKPWQ